jgi:hypothetical protein
MKCLHDGYFAVSLLVSAEFIAHAEEQAKRCGCIDATDYMQGLLNMALTRDLVEGKDARE